MKPFLTICFALSLLALPLLMTGCEKKSDKKLPYEHSVENIPAISASENLSKPVTPTISHTPDEGYFILRNRQGITHTLQQKADKLLHTDISQPIVLLHFFTTWSIPCQAEAPYLSKLQKAYPKKLFVMGVLLHPQKHLQALDTFVDKQHADYFISSSKDNDALAQSLQQTLHLSDTFPVPLTVIFKNGRYYRHYEGAVPIEMLEHDIKTMME